MHAKPSLEVILILDEHYTHTHTWNLDVISSFYGTLKILQQLKTVKKVNPGKINYGFVGKSLLFKTASLGISVNGFRNCSIMLLDRNRFWAHDFLIHEKIKTFVNIENIIKGKKLRNDINETTAGTEPVAQKPGPNDL